MTASWAAAADVCENGCTEREDCDGRCGNLPPRIASMPDADFAELLEFANDVQAWSLQNGAAATFGDAAVHFKRPVERIADAVVAHYWMFTPDKDLPLAERTIDHEGE